MSTIAVPDWHLSIPPVAHSITGFRNWTRSSEFPQRGRIDLLAGNVEVDMAAEDLFCHGHVKGEIYSFLYLLVKHQQLGAVFCDSTRVSSPAINLSVEPDIVFVSHESLKNGRTTFIPKSTQEEGRFIEIEGSPDLIVEIVSDSSEDKDGRRLPIEYAKAGVKEYWLADARGDEMLFCIHTLRDDKYVAATKNAQGYQFSPVFQRYFRLDRLPHETLPWTFNLLATPGE